MINNVIYLRYPRHLQVIIIICLSPVTSIRKYRDVSIISIPWWDFVLERKKEQHNSNNKIATICLFCGFYLAYSCVSHVMFPCKREQPWIYFGGTLSVWISLFFPALCLSATLHCLNAWKRLSISECSHWGTCLTRENKLY